MSDPKPEPSDCVKGTTEMSPEFKTLFASLPRKFECGTRRQPHLHFENGPCQHCGAPWPSVK
jgi:hypothetical protein